MPIQVDIRSKSKYLWHLKRTSAKLNKDHFVICEETICRWLPLKDSNITQRRRSLTKAVQTLVHRGYLVDYQFHRDLEQCVFAYREADTSGEQSQYKQIMDWLDSIRYFYKKRMDQITALPMADIIECYPGIRQEYERRQAIGETPKSDWIISAFLERWKFDDRQ